MTDEYDRFIAHASSLMDRMEEAGNRFMQSQALMAEQYALMSERYDRLMLAVNKLAKRLEDDDGDEWKRS